MLSTTRLIKSKQFIVGMLAVLCFFVANAEDGGDSTTMSDSDTVNSLILVDEEAGPVLDLMEQLTGKTILRQQNLPKVQINLKLDGPVSRKQAILAVESILSMNGVAVLEMGEYLKAVPTIRVVTQSPLLITKSSLDLPPSQKIYSKVFPLEYLLVKDMKPALKLMLTPKVGEQVGLTRSNAILVTDTLVNIQRIETVINRLDQPAVIKDDIKFYSLSHASAVEIKKKLDGMKKGALRKHFDTSIFEADKSTNQLIVVTHANNLPMIEKMVKQLDLDVEPLSKSYVYRLLHAQAKDVTALIKALVKGGPSPSSGKKDETTPSQTARERLLERIRATQASKGLPVTPAAAKTAASGETLGQSFSDTLTVEADERSNSIVMFGTPQDVELVKDLVRELDVVLAQVKIEVVIAEVTLGDDQVSGLSSFGIEHHSVIASDSRVDGKSRLTDISTFTTSSITAAPLGLVGALKSFQFDTVFRVAQRDSNVSVLSAPMIMTTHNRKAVVDFGREVPIITSSTTTVNNPEAQRTTTKYEKVSILLEVTPLIGPDGVIEMDIKQTVRDIIGQVGEGTPNADIQPIISRREASSYVSVRDGEILVLAGMQQRKETEIKGKVWLFGYLPIIGDLLFSPKSLVVEKTELVIFIKPYIVNNQFVSDQQTERAMNMIESSREEVQEFFDTGRFTTVETSSCKKKKRKHKALFCCDDLINI